MENEDLFNDADDVKPTVSALAAEPAAPAAPAATAPTDGKSGGMLLRQELAEMLQGFGDVEEPYDPTLMMLEGMVLEYIKQMCDAAKAVGKQDQIKLEDIHYLIRRDAQKCAIVKESLDMEEGLRKARRQGDDVTEKN